MHVLYERRELYDAAVEKWGEQAEIDQAIEQFAELIVQLSRWPNCKTSQNIADCFVTLERLAVMTDDETSITVMIDDNLVDLREQLGIWNPETGMP